MIIRPLTIMAPRPTPPGPTDEVQIGNQIWKSKNLAIDDGQGGIYTRFQPTESGTYTFSLKWNAPNGIDFWNSQSSSTYRQFGMWFDTSLNISYSSGYEGNRSQGILMYDHDNTSAISLEQTGMLNLDANTNYYVWLSCGTLEDNKLQVFNFTEARLVKV